MYLNMKKILNSQHFMQISFSYCILKVSRECSACMRCINMQL